jgi:PTH1 family peptidyl-tRNA hydrolase
VLAKPLTYVNESGKAVKELLSKYHSNLADVIVISDDFNLTKFNTRARFGGGDGGHNGLKSIISNCDNGFFRIRIGLDRKIEDFKELVLSKIDESDYPLYVESFAKITDGLTLFFKSNDIDLMMRTINKQ